MSTYERIRFDGKTVILQDPVETTIQGRPALSGIEVNREGIEVAPAGVDERRHIIELSVITRRVPLVMNRHYGELETA